MDTATIWAQTLTDERIANDLQRLADDVRFHNRVERKALLHEAARRLLAKPKTD